eukprot:6382414-Amphidinium_carterae.1
MEATRMRMMSPPASFRDQQNQINNGDKGNCEFKIVTFAVWSCLVKFVRAVLSIMDRNTYWMVFGGCAWT